MSERFELGVIGAGNMAEAIVRGVLARGLFRSEQIIAADPSPQRRELFHSQLRVNAVEDNLQVARNSNILLLSVKPQQMAAALSGIGACADCSRTLIISIAAGISTAFIEKHLGNDDWRVVRTMPNTPMLVGQGIVAIAPGAHATTADLEIARRLFSAAADVVDVDERYMNAVTALSGSGPAYFFYLVEHMIRAGVELGLTPEQSHKLVTKTALGAATMLVQPQDSPQELRRKVTSPGGTTQAAIEHMEKHQVAQTIVDAIRAAERRGQELSESTKA
jgi:pyrroline-5-carboxylate reductase